MKNFDLFGEPLKLYYNGEYLFKTGLSGILSVSLLMVTATYLIWNVYSMTERSGLIMDNYQTTMKDDDPLYIFNQSNFYLGFRLFTSSGNNIFAKRSNLSKYFKFKSIYFEKYKDGSSDSTTLNIFPCNISINPMVPNLTGLYCLDFNNSELGGNYYSISQYFYVQANIYFNYSLFYSDYNTSVNIFPVRAAVYYPTTYIDPLDYDDPLSNGPANYNFRCNYNITKNVEISAQLIEMNTDSSYISKSKSTQNAFTSNYKFFSEEYLISNRILSLTFFLDPIKNVYNRRYMKLQDVINFVNSLAHILFLIFGLLCSSYNEYKLKVDFIEENILYRMDEIEKNDFNRKPLILNTELPIINTESPIDPIVIAKSRNEPENEKSTKMAKLKYKFNKKPEKIKMKSFFNHLFCFKPNKISRSYSVSDAANQFLKDFIDVKKYILLLAQFEELKEIWLRKYQNVVLNRSKIILKPKEMMINDDESKFEKSFLKLKRNIDEEKYDKVDLMLLTKF